MLGKGPQLTHSVIFDECIHSAQIVDTSLDTTTSYWVQVHKIYELSSGSKIYLFQTVNPAKGYDPVGTGVKGNGHDPSTLDTTAEHHRSSCGNENPVG